MQLYTKLINRLKAAEVDRQQKQKKLLDRLTSATWRYNEFVEAAIAAEIHQRLKEFVDNLHPDLCIEDESRLGEARIGELMLMQTDVCKQQQAAVFFIYQDANEAKLMFQVFGKLKSIFQFTAIL